MKKKLFLGLLAAAAVSFTACQKDEVISEMPQDNAIGFGTYVGRDAQTKASVTDITALQDSDAGFGVFAYYTGDDDYDENPTKPDFMYNQQVRYVTSAWNYSPLKYWPGADQKISFFAYAPYVSAPDGKITALPAANVEGDPTIGFTVPATVSAQIDLLYATPVTNATATTPANPVTLNFNHALSRIGFKAATARNDFKVTINEIKVSGKFNTTGVLNLATVDSEDGKWTTLNVSTENDGISSYIVDEFLAVAENLSNTAAQPISKSDGYLMVLPTDFSENDVTVTVNYDYTYYGTTVTGRVQSGTISNLILAKGKAYTFVLTLNPTSDLTPITFNVEVNPWDPTDPTDDSNDVPVVPVQ